MKRKKIIKKTEFNFINLSKTVFFTIFCFAREKNTKQFSFYLSFDISGAKSLTRALQSIPVSESRGVGTLSRHSKSSSSSRIVLLFSNIWVGRVGTPRPGAGSPQGSGE